METKLFEIRDRMTFAVVMATGIESDLPKEVWLLAKAHMGKDGKEQHEHRHIFLMEFSSCVSSLKGYTWGNRTLRIAHDYIEKNWDTLHSGDLIDVEFLEGETKQPKKSEFLEETT